MFLEIQKRVFGNPRTVWRVFVCLLWGIVMIGSGYWAGWRQGKSEGYLDAGSLLRSSAFVQSFGALKDLRNGDWSAAINTLEPYCYSSAADLFENPGSRGEMIREMFSEELIKYRADFGNPPDQQYPTEERLDRLLRANGLGREARVPSPL